LIKEISPINDPMQGFDVDDVLSLDSRFNAKKVMCGLMYRRRSPNDENVVLCVLKSVFILYTYVLFWNMKSYVKLVKMGCLETPSFRVKKVDFWVKKGLSAHVSADSGSDGPIRRIHYMDMAYPYL
ncbi:hypothetical protein Tco_0999902, partial [Tanacetum coccineum]